MMSELTKAENNCPQCETSLDWCSNGKLGKGNYACPQCQVLFLKQYDCPDCGEDIDKLQACGSVSFFCKSCNSLKSKSRVKGYFVKTNS